MKEHESPYAAFANNPIWFRDIQGNDTVKFYNDVFLFPAQEMPGDRGVLLENFSSSKIVIKVCDGQDVFIYISRVYDNNISSPSSVTVKTLDPFSNPKQGVFRIPYFFGLLSYAADDQQSLAMIMPDELIDYFEYKSMGTSDEYVYKTIAATSKSLDVFNALKGVEEVVYSFAIGNWATGTLSKFMGLGELYLMRLD